MSIYASWPAIGEQEDSYEPNGEVLIYLGSHVYPDPETHKPAAVGISHIPGFVRREPTQDDDEPFAPYLRLDLVAWSEEHHGLATLGAVVLTREGARKLRDQLTQWLDSEVHPA